MYIGRDFSPQQPGESEVVGIDFINDLETGEALTSSIWVCTVSDGFDPAPSGRLEGPSMVVKGERDDPDMKTATIQRVGDCMPDVTYKLEATCVTTLGNTRTLHSYIRGVRGITP